MLSLVAKRKRNTLRSANCYLPTAKNVPSAETVIYIEKMTVDGSSKIMVQ